MQAIHETYADPSTSTSNFKKGIQYEDMKGAQFYVQSNLKIMSRSIAALSKISEDVLIEVSDSGLFFKVVNRSKFCVFRFAPEFFNSCDLSLINSKAVNICRISMKSAQRIFKGVAFSEKNFVGCEFRIDPRAEKLMVKFQMNYDIERTINAKLREMGSVLHKPTYDRAKCRNTTVVFASTLIPILAQLKSDIEVTMKVSSDGLTIRNFHSADGITMFNMSDQRGGKKVKTETTITVDKLSRHKVQMAVEFSFYLKEFLSIVTFADQLGSEVCLYYDLPGKPLILSIEAHPNFDIELALATMGNEDEIDLDGGIIEETLLRQEMTKATQSIETCSHSSSQKKSTIPEFDISSSGTRSKRGPILQSRDEHPNTQSEHSRNKFISSRVQEKTTLPLADRSWRDNEIVINNEPQERTPDTEPIEHMEVQEYIPYETMNAVEQQTIAMEEDVPVQKAMQNVNIEERISNPPGRQNEKSVSASRNMWEQVEESPMEENQEKSYQEFDAPDPKRIRVEENRNKKIRRILMGTGRKELMRMSQQFNSRPLTTDTQS
uniref:Cell cycle checkpoint control protein n=1 Tax=Caenorhabditis tropicalis TaxID=1561998 RepID=A0A1I7TMA1_9PELO